MQVVDAARAQALRPRDAQTLAAAWQLHRVVAVSLHQAGLSQQAHLESTGLEVQAAEAELARGLPLPSLEPQVLQAYLDSLAVTLSDVEVKGLLGFQAADSCFARRALQDRPHARLH